MNESVPTPRERKHPSQKSKPSFAFLLPKIALASFFCLFVCVCVDVVGRITDEQRLQFPKRNFSFVFSFFLVAVFPFWLSWRKNCPTERVAISFEGRTLKLSKLQKENKKILANKSRDVNAFSFEEKQKHFQLKKQGGITHFLLLLLLFWGYRFGSCRPFFIVMRNKRNEKYFNLKKKLLWSHVASFVFTRRN